MKSRVAKNQHLHQLAGAQYAALGTIVPGDEPYYHEPFCWALLAQGLPMSNNTLQLNSG